MSDNDKGIQTKDSGERQLFETGCQRDTQTGKGRPDLMATFAQMRLWGVYERGSYKYDDDNWMKGMNWSRVYSSVIRHMVKWKFRKMLGLKMDEDHLAQAAWNVFTLMDYELIHSELDNIQDKYKPYIKDPEKTMQVIEEYLGKMLES
jgi:hypothetical protein